MHRRCEPPLRRARLRRGLEGRSAQFSAVRGLRNQQPLAVIKRKPRLPLGVGDRFAALQQLAQRRELFGDVRVHSEDRLCRGPRRHPAGHVPGEMDHRVALADVNIVVRDGRQAGILEVLLDEHFHIVAPELGAKPVAIGAEFVGNTGNENLDGHSRPHGNRRERG
jgi:hypothetical protein